MNSELQVSVIIPIFQSSATLSRALDSISDSSAIGKGICVEVILVFDGPDEGSQYIAECFAKNSKIETQILHQPHAGVSSARNLGIQSARARFLTFLDADDEVTPERFSLVSQEFDGLLIGRQRVVFDSPSDLPAGIASPTESPSHYFNSVVAPKDTICQLGGFDPSLPFGQDVDLVVRARRTGFHVQLVDEVTTIRHITGRNASLDITGARRDLLKSLTKTTGT